MNYRAFIQNLNFVGKIVRGEKERSVKVFLVIPQDSYRNLDIMISGGASA